MISNSRSAFWSNWLLPSLDSVITQRVLAAWKLHEGDTYDAQYPKKFTEDVAGLLPGQDWNIVIHESVEDKDWTVDVSLHFEHKP